ncbi:MAG: hypothetical protein ABW145_04605, partial [Candidatus Thiodiazotropha sp.]
LARGQDRHLLTLYGRVLRSIVDIGVEGLNSRHPVAATHRLRRSIDDQRNLPATAFAERILYQSAMRRDIDLPGDLIGVQR